MKARLSSNLASHNSTSERNDTMAKILKDPAPASFSPRHQKRKNINLAVLRENKLKLSSERDKSI